MAGLQQKDRETCYARGAGSIFFKILQSEETTFTFHLPVFPIFMFLPFVQTS